MNGFIAIILIIGLLILGYYFLKNFDSIDYFFFKESEPDYDSFGILVVYISAFVGALVGSVFFYTQAFDSHAVGLLNWVIFFSTLILGLAYCISVYQSFIYMSKTGYIIGKMLFMFVSCLLGGVIGFAGSIVIIAICILFLFLSILGKATLGDSASSKKGHIVDSYGNKSEIEEESTGICGEKYYRDEHGNQYTSSGGGNGPVQRTN